MHAGTYHFPNGAQPDAPEEIMMKPAKVLVALAAMAIVTVGTVPGQPLGRPGSPAARSCLQDFQRLLVREFDPPPVVRGAVFGGDPFAMAVDRVGDRWMIAATDQRTGDEVMRATCTVTGPGPRVALHAVVSG